MQNELLNTKNTALLVIDIQKDFCSLRDQDPHNLHPIRDIIPDLENFINEIRKFNIPIIFTKYIEDENTPQNIKNLGKDGYCKRGSGGEEIYKLKVEDKDTVIEKRTWDAISNLDLDKILKSKSIENLLITGIETEMCVFSTLSSAFSKGYNNFLIEDLVSTKNEKMEFHNELIELIKRYYGFVIKSDDALKYFKNL